MAHNSVEQTAEMMVRSMVVEKVVGKVESTVSE